MSNQGRKRGNDIQSFFKPKSRNSSSANADTSIPNEEAEPSSKSQRVEFDETCLERDPGLRIPIWQHPVNQRDGIRRAYINMGPYQPKLAEYKPSKFGKQDRRFQYAWFKKFPWLEYSPSKDAIFCFPCYLFELNETFRSTFTVKGFRDWRRVNSGSNCGILSHIGGPNSMHNKSAKDAVELRNVPQHIDKVMNRESSEQIQRNRLRLASTIETVRWLSLQACALRGHDESSNSQNCGNFIEMLKLLGKWNSDIDDVILENAPGNAQYTSPDVQKEILLIIGNRVRSKIRDEIGDAKFCILVDEAKDASNKEQMAIILRFVDISGFLRERFFQIVHVPDTTAATLKEKVYAVLTRYNLDIHNMRGQGYDGPSNMSGAFNGLQALFLEEYPYAYYVHCFAHRLQLALVAAAEKEMSIWLFFSKLTTIVNLVTSSSKRNIELQSAQADEIARSIIAGERDTRRGANQIGTLHRAGTTRWSSHFDSICSLVDMYGATMDVLERIISDGSSNLMRGEAGGSLMVMKSFEFIFNLHLVHKIMGITDLLCRALQQKSLDIINAVDLVKSTKELLLTLRNKGFDIHLTYVKSLCMRFDIDIPEMSAPYKHFSRSCQKKDTISVLHHFWYDIFNAAIDFQLEELKSRFSDEAVELLVLSSALDPKDNFKLFDINKICALAEKYYPKDFTEQEMHHLRCQLQHYKVDVVRHEKFQDMSTISELCRGLYETKKSQNYTLIDRLIRLVLTLPVSTATTECAFSAMKHVKTILRNKMGEDFLTDSMSIYIEREFSASIDSDSIIDEYTSLKNRRSQFI